MQIDLKFVMLILEKEIVKVVCGAPNAREGLITIYAPPGAVVPKIK